MKDKLTLGVALVAIVIAALAYSSKQEVVQVPLGARPSNEPTETQVNLGGTVLAKVNATSSSVATYTLTGTDLGNSGSFYNTIVFTKTGAVATTTWTFPASSTVPFLPGVGQRSDLCFEVATSSEANPGLTLAAGTGWQLGTASTTPTGLTINGGQMACGYVERSFDSDLFFNFVVFKDAH